MAESERILSQHEVDALLSAIDSGEVEVTPEQGGGLQTMPYDFKRPERVAREQLRALETLHEVYARNLQSAFSGMLRTMVDVKIASVDQLTFLEFINSLPNPTVFTVLSCEPLEGNFIFEVNPVIAFPIVERLLGSGKVGSSQPERALTPIEWKLMDGVILRALDLLKEVWSTIVPVNFKVSAREANPQLMQIFSANEAVVSVVIEVTMGEHKGYLNICLPVMAIEAYMEKITTHTWFSSRKKDQAPTQEAMISRQLASAELTLAAHLPVETLRLKDLETLRAGDILQLHHPQAAPVMVSVGGRVKYIGKLGSLKDRKAVKVLAGVDPARVSSLTPPRPPMDVLRQAAPEPVADGAPAPAIVANVLRLPLTATVVLAEKTMRVREVLALKVGEVVEFQKRENEPLSLRAGDHLLATGSAVKIGEKFGLQVMSVLDPRATVAALGTPPGP